MKKLFLILVNILLFTNNVYANEWSSEKLEGNNVEVEYRYRFFKEKEEGKYVNLKESVNYDFRDLDNYIYSDYSDYKNSCKNNDEYVIEYQKKYEYQKLIPVKYIKIRNDDTEDLLKISNYKIHNNMFVSKSKLHDCSNCTTDGNNYIISPGGHMTIETDNEIELNKLDLEFSFEGEKHVNFALIYSKSDDFSKSNLVSYLNTSTLISKYHVNEGYLVYSNYDNKVYTDYDIVQDKYIKVLSKEEVCRYKEKLVYSYNIIREYYDDNYYKDVSELTNVNEEDNYIKDLEDYKIYYRYIEDTKNNIDNNNTNNIDSDLKLVKTGIYDKKNSCNYPLIFIIILSLLTLFILKKMSFKKNN